MAWMLAGGMRWNALVCEQRRHPVVARGAFELRLQLRNLVGARLVPGDHDIEQLAVDREIADLVDRARGHPPRQLRVQRGARLGRAATDHGDGALGFLHLHHAGDEPHGALVGVAFLEEGAASRHGAHDDFLRKRREVIPLQAVERREGLEQLNACFAFFEHFYAA